MPSNKRRVRIKWRDPKSIRSHWGPFAFDTTTGISRHSYPEFWPQVRAARHDPHLRTMFEVLEEPVPVVVERKPQFSPGQAPWDKPVDVVAMRAANHDDAAPRFSQRDMLRTAEQLAAAEHAAALGTLPAPSKAKLAEQAFEQGVPFEGGVTEEPAEPVATTKPHDVPPPPATDAGDSWNARMKAAKAAKSSGKQKR